MPDVLFQALCAAIDHFSSGFAILDAGGYLLKANRAAQAMIEAEWPICLHHGCVRTIDRSQASALVEGFRWVLDQEALEDPDHVSFVIPLGSARSAPGVALATLKPLISRDKWLIGLFVTVSADVEYYDISCFARCFDLTPAEARVLAEFMKGNSVAEAAHALALSQNTVKTHLRNIFTKTNTSRQPELMRLVAGLKSPVRNDIQALKTIKSQGRHHNGISEPAARGAAQRQSPSKALLGLPHANLRNARI